MSYADSTNLIIIFNAVGVPARLLTGFVADKFCGPLNGIIFLIFLNGIFAFVWIAVRSSVRSPVAVAPSWNCWASTWLGPFVSSCAGTGEAVGVLTG